MRYLNHNINKISEYPFGRLRDLLSKEIKNKKTKVLDLSIGQPYHKFPLYVKNVLAKENTKWSLYPPVKGVSVLRAAYLGWLKRRFSLKSPFLEKKIFCLSQAQEKIFSVSLVLSVKQIIVPNPFYQVYLELHYFRMLL